MDTRGLATVAAVVALSATYTPITGLAVSVFFGFFLIVAVRDREIRW